MTASVWQQLSEQVIKPQRVKKTKSQANADLWSAVFDLDLELVREALEDGASPDNRQRGANNLYPILHVLQKGRFDIADVLVAAGADLSRNYGSSDLVSIAFIEDRPEVLDWIFSKIKNEIFKSAQFNRYMIETHASQEKSKCIEWFINRLAEKNSKNKFLDYCGHAPISRWALSCEILSKMKDSTWTPEKIKHWKDVLVNAFDTPDQKSIHSSFTYAVEHNSSGVLRLFLATDWIPETPQGSLSWPWRAALFDSPLVLKWMLSATDFCRSFKEDADLKPKLTVQKLLSGGRVPHQSILEQLSNQELLPDLDSLSNHSLYPSLFIHNALYMSKTSVEWFARKWPAALKVKNKAGRDVFEEMEQHSYYKDKALSLRMVAEKIMIKKAVGRAPRKSATPPKKRL